MKHTVDRHLRFDKREHKGGIVTRDTSDAYRDNYDAIFRKPARRRGLKLSPLTSVEKFRKDFFDDVKPEDRPDFDPTDNRDRGDEA